MKEHRLYNLNLTVMGWYVFASDRFRYINNNDISIKSANLIFKALKGLDK